MLKTDKVIIRKFFILNLGFFDPFPTKKQQFVDQYVLHNYNLVVV